ncbi:MAG: tRNA (5-methylaminomethyl-2-thiouridine)(34)-methyltransferase MnmD [Daejeonella sp.]|nr:tRNA (5-methylaminomethyl-2-thiouridine)(34)-methyltransferase MnmD [Daejeonella sp.]
MDHLSFAFTSDGSKTLFNREVGEHYHSRHGALQESKHVFLNTGMRYFLEKSGLEKVKILEVGFGTGLNFLITADFCLVSNIQLDYTGIEAYPLIPEIVGNTGYENYVSDDLWNSFTRQYQEAQNSEISIGKSCTLKIEHKKLLEFNSKELFDVLYFDAFAAVHQPEMWNQESLKHISKFLKTGGVFVTYAITGDLKRTMKSLGFVIEKAPGAAGKREMLRAIKM